MIPLNLFSTMFDPTSKPIDWSSSVGKEYISAIEKFIDELSNADYIKSLRGDPIFDSIMEYASKNYDAKTFYGNLNWFLSDLEQNFKVPLYIDRVSDNNGDPYIRYTFMSPKTTYIVSWVRNFQGRLYIDIYTPQIVKGVEINICRNGIIVKK